MSVLTLKIIAVISMLLDHIGYTADIDMLRCIGRLAFPIYAFLIGNGFRHTTDPKRYVIRLLLLAALSQIPYTLFLYHRINLAKLNVFFTLSAGLITLWVLERCPSPIGKLLFCAGMLSLCAGLEYVAPLDYGLRGVLLIIALYYCSNPAVMAATFAAIYYLPLWNALLQSQPLPENTAQSVCALASLPLLCKYNGRLGYHNKILQWAFYLFYPAHLLLLEFFL